MAHVCSPVAGVTAMDGDRPPGPPGRAFLALSMDPPMTAVALDRQSEVLGLIEGTRRFAINVLGTAQSSLAVAFARKGRAKFDGVEWAEHLGVPRLPDVSIWIACTVDAVVDGGDHKIVTGSVNEVEHRESNPLTYHRRVFGTHAPTSVL